MVHVGATISWMIVCSLFAGIHIALLVMTVSRSSHIIRAFHSHLVCTVRDPLIWHRKVRGRSKIPWIWFVGCIISMVLVQHPCRSQEQFVIRVAYSFERYTAQQDLELPLQDEDRTAGLILL